MPQLLEIGELPCSSLHTARPLVSGAFAAIFLEVQMRSAQMKKDPTGGKSSNPSKGDGVKRSLSFGSLAARLCVHPRLPFAEGAGSREFRESVP